MISSINNTRKNAIAVNAFARSIIAAAIAAVAAVLL